MLSVLTSARRAVAVACVLASATLVGCSTSDDDLTSTGSDLARVSGVELSQSTETTPDLSDSPGEKIVRVTMEPDADADEVLAVLDAYSDALDDGDLRAVSVVLDDARLLELVSGDRNRPDRAMVDTLLAGHDDLSITSLRLTTVPDDPRLEVALGNVPFTDLVQRAGDWAKTADVEHVEVSTGKVTVAVVPGDDDTMLAARVALVDEISQDFNLVETRVSGKGPLEIVVAPGSLQAVKVFLDVEADVRHGDVTVRSLG